MTDQRSRGGNSSKPRRSQELVEVTIFGQRHRLRAADPERLRAAARLVDERLRRLAKAVGTRDTPRLMLLMALELADDLIGSDARRSATAERLALLAERIEQTLEQS